LDFLVRQLEDVLAGIPTSPLEPPEVDLVCSHAIQVSQRLSVLVPDVQLVVFRTRHRNDRYNRHVSGISFRLASVDIPLNPNVYNTRTYLKIHIPRSFPCITLPVLTLLSSGPCLRRNGKDILSCMASGWGRHTGRWKKSSRIQRTQRSSVACTRRQ
jgi:hypothetical protein